MCVLCVCSLAQEYYGNIVPSFLCVVERVFACLRSRR